MDNPRTDQPAPHAGKKNKAHTSPKDADSPASKPQGTLRDQVQTMESEGQAQPQEGDFTPEELDDPTAGRADRKPGPDSPDQRPLTDNKAGG
jgi:hypothetical protein